MRIDSIAVHPVSKPVNPEFAIVSAAGAHPESHFAVVELRTAEDVSGFGEASVTAVWSGETRQSVEHAVSAILGPAVCGRDPFDTGALTEAMDSALIGNPFTKAAVEMAAIDLAGKILNVPAHALLGGSRRAGAIPLKFSIGAFPAAKAAQVARTAAERGLRAVKVKVGLDVASDIARVEAVRAELGAAFPVAVDANGGWTEAEAIAAIPALERLGVNALEQPLRRGEFRGCARIRRRTSMPVMLDESVFTPQDALEAVRLDACDLISIYPGKNGGITRSLAIAQIAAAAGVECIIGSNLEMDLGSAAMLALAVAAPALSTSVNHDIIGPLYYQTAGGDPPIAYRDGCALLPAGPGLGLAPFR